MKHFFSRRDFAAGPAAALAPWRRRWQALAAREQNLLLLAAVLVLLALLWWIALAPALHSLRTAPARHAQAEHQLQQMLQMQAEAEQLRALPQSTLGDARALLQSSLATELGPGAKLQWLGNRAQISFNAVPAPALARWLAQVRDNTRATAAEMKLGRAEAGGPAGEPSAVRWSGSLVLELPAGGQAAP